MRSSFRHLASKLLSVLLGAALLLSVGPAAFRTIAQLGLLVAHISLQICEVGIIVLRACGI
jgi:hypothetical protein